MKRINNIYGMSASFLIMLAITVWHNIQLPRIHLVLLVIAMGCLAKLCALRQGVSWRLWCTLFLGLLIGQTASKPTIHHPQTAQLCGHVVDGPHLHMDAIAYDVKIGPGQQARLWVSRQIHEAQKRQALTPGVHLCVWGKWTPEKRRRYPFERQRLKLARAQGKVGTFVAQDDVLMTHFERDFIWRIRRQLSHQRLAIEMRIMHLLPRQRAAFVLAMITGSRGLLTPEERAPFDLTNTSHILAISGLHLGVLGGLIWTCLSWILAWRPTLVSKLGIKRLGALPLLLLLSLYVMMVGAPISSRRALSMLLIVCVGYLLRWSISPIRALLIGISIMAIWNPWVLFEPGFQLSVSATMGILLYWAHAKNSNNKPGQKWLTYVGMSISASLSTLPIVMDLNFEWHWVGLLLNLIITPLVSLLVFPLMLLGTLMAFIDLEISRYILTVSTDILHALRSLAVWSLEVSGSPWRPGHFHMLPLCGALFLIWLTIARRHSTRVAMCTCLSAWLMLVLPGFLASRAGHTHVWALPVGQGDATLVKWQNRTILIDGGGARFGKDPGLHVVMPMLKYQGIDRLDVVILTHPDLDHMGGLHAINKFASPHHFYYNAASIHHPGLQKLLLEMKHAGVALHPLAQKQTPHQIQQTPLWLWRPLHPTKKENDKSVIVTLKLDRFKALFMGDLEKPGERQWLKHHNTQNISLLKVGHHGSKTSTSATFLRAINPTAAFVSCGRHNQFGHPHSQVMTRLAQHNIDVWRTDTQALVHFLIKSDGSWHVKTLHAM